MTCSKILINTFLVLLASVFLSFQANSAVISNITLPKADKQLESWQEDLAQWRQVSPSLTELENRQNEVFKLKQNSDTCVQVFTSQLDSIQEKLKALGDETKDEVVELKQRRNDLIKQKQSTESELAVCRLLSLGLKELQESHKTMRSRLISAALSHREPPIWEVMATFTKQPTILNDNFKFTFSFWPSTLLAIITLLVLFPLAKHASQFLHRRYSIDQEIQSTSGESPFVSMLAKRLPWIAMLATAVIFLYSGGSTLLSAIIFALLVSVSFAPLLEKLLCHKNEKCKEGLPARGLLDVVLVGLVVYFSGVDEILRPESFLLLQGGYYVLLMAFSLWILWELVKREDFLFLNSVRIPVAVAILTGPIAMLIGYRAVSDLLVPGVYGSLLGILFAFTAFQAGTLFFRMFEPDEANTNTSLRHFLGYNNQEIIPGLWMGRLLLIVLVIGGLGYWMLIAWKVPHSDINILNAYFTEGFPIGAVTVVPSKIISAILAFFLLLTLARWLKNQLAERWLKKTRLDAGARESIVSLTTYAIVGIAFVIALGMAGVDFQNVAIVAGALSVGIGFGLQNIVNNFVSGLILLFERPVKPGDWIVVGATEGYVKKISIRYTQIQTFDRADVLVPNSELISSQVTNWMLQDSMGRVIVPVGVAYGTDTKQVRDILYRIASEHPFVLVNDWRVSGPKVMFMGFGDSSLNFEVRCYIKDIDYRLSVRSDLLFVIDEEFRKAGIEIPFPQRVVHMTEKSEMDDKNIIEDDLDGRE